MFTASSSDQSVELMIFTRYAVIIVVMVRAKYHWITAEKLVLPAYSTGSSLGVRLRWVSRRRVDTMEQLKVPVSEALLQQLYESLSR